MMRGRAKLVLLLLLIGAGSDPAPAATNPLPAWLAGDWCNQADGVDTLERWLAPAGGMMLGVGRTVRPGRHTQFEFLRIESVDGVLNYFAMPQGRPATAFAQVDSGDNWIRFENRAHDFPQQIDYRLAGNGELRAQIAGPGLGGQTQTISFLFGRCVP